MGTIQIKKVEKTVTTGKQGEERQKVKTCKHFLVFAVPKFGISLTYS